MERRKQSRARAFKMLLSPKKRKKKSLGVDWTTILATVETVFHATVNFSTTAEIQMIAASRLNVLLGRFGIQIESGIIRMKR